MPHDENEFALQNLFAAISDGIVLNEVVTGRIIAANPAASALYGCTAEEFVGAPLSRFMQADGYAHFLESAGAFAGNDTFEVALGQKRSDGTPFSVEVRGTAYISGELRCWLSIFRDVTERVNSEQALRQLVASRTREQATLFEISRILASSLELNPSLILDQLHTIIEFGKAMVFILEGPNLVASAVQGSPALDRLLPLRIRLTDPNAIETLLNNHQPLRIANVQGTTTAARFFRSLFHGPVSMLLAGAQAWMWVPFIVKGRFIGGIGIIRDQRDSFTPHQAELALTMANPAAIALDNAQLFEQAQTVASLQERQRLAQNLHDAVNQSLFSAGLIAELLPRLWEKDQQAGRESLQDLRRLTRGAQAELRGLLAELRPQVLMESDLSELLQQLGDALISRTNIPVIVTLVGQGNMPADVQLSFYRLCQEAFNNIAKHAKASEVVVRLTYDEGGNAELFIHDNGRGFYPAQIPLGHYGLTMMRERAEAVGLQLSIISEPAQGTEIVIRWIPVTEPIR